MYERNANAPAVIYEPRGVSEVEMASHVSCCMCVAGVTLEGHSLYRSVHALVAPYRAEGFGLPILEALACATPVIVTSGGGSADFVTPDTAYLIEAHEFVARNTTKCAYL